jgi:E3 SUMO-protein ligase PIAS1
LTLDSDDEQEVVTSHVQGKRKAAEAELDHSILPDQTWKKTRVDPSSRILPAPRGPSGAVHGVAPVLHTSSINNHSPSSPGRYSSSFAGNNLPRPPPPPVYPSYNPRMVPNNPDLQLPPLSNPYHPRQSQNSRWPA